MLFLARFILKGPSQAALVAATMAILGLLFPPASWISGAAISLVTLVFGLQRGLLTSALALVGTALFAYLIFQAPQITIGFALLAWLPALLVATILRQTVSLAYSLQVLTAICLLLVGVIYTLFPDMGEFWREPLSLMVEQLAGSTNELSQAEWQQAENWIIDFIPGFLVAGILFGAMLSLLLARWWQAFYYNPGGFAEEFQSMNLGKASALVAAVIMLIAVAVGSVFTFALVTVVMVLYLTQGLALLHAVVKIKQLNVAWVYAFYVVTFFIPHLLMLLVFAAIVDPWIEIRQRVRQSSKS